jgi:hypothetical protein
MILARFGFSNSASTDNETRGTKGPKADDMYGDNGHPFIYWASVTKIDGTDFDHIHIIRVWKIGMTPGILICSIAKLSIRDKKIPSTTIPI